MRNKKSSFKNLKKVERKKEEDSIVMNPIFKTVVVFVCITVDAVNLFLIFDHILGDNYLLTGTVVAVSSIILTVLPILLAKYVASLQIPKRTVLITASVICVTGFLILLLSTLAIRWYGRYTLFDSEESKIYADPVSAGNGIALFLGVLPLITGMFCFLIHFIIDGENSYINTIRLQQIDLRETISETDVFISLLKDELENHQLRSIEEEKYMSALKRNQLILLYCKIVARRILAERLKTANSVSLLMEENRLAETIVRLLPPDSLK